jgi:hypothetical protein
MRLAVDEEIKRAGCYKYEKNGYLITGFVDE